MKFENLFITEKAVTEWGSVCNKHREEPVELIKKKIARAIHLGTVVYEMNVAPCGTK